MFGASGLSCSSTEKGGLGAPERKGKEGGSVPRRLSPCWERNGGEIIRETLILPLLIPPWTERTGCLNQSRPGGPSRCTESNATGLFFDLV